MKFFSQSPNHVPPGFASSNYNRHMAIRAVFFDLDETLLDTTGTNPQRAQRIATRLRSERSEIDAALFVERLLASPKTESAVVKEFGLLGTSLGDEIVELWFFQGCLDLTRSFADTEPALRELTQTHQLGVITNGREYRQRAKFESLPIHNLFDVFLTSEAAGVEKPSPEIFQLALSRAGLAPHEAAFVGDRLDTDILGARQAGMAAVWFDHEGRLPAGDGPNPDATFTSFAELPSVLGKLA